MELKLYVSKEVTLISQRSVCNLQTAGPVKTATFSSSCCFVVFTCKVSGNFVLALRIFFSILKQPCFQANVAVVLFPLCFCNIQEPPNAVGSRCLSHPKCLRKCIVTPLFSLPFEGELVWCYKSLCCQEGDGELRRLPYDLRWAVCRPDKALVSRQLYLGNLKLSKQTIQSHHKQL